MGELPCAIWSGAVPITAETKRQSSCGTLQDEGTLRAKLFFENVFLLFIAERSSAALKFPQLI